MYPETLLVQKRNNFGFLLLLFIVGAWLFARQQVYSNALQQEPLAPTAHAAECKGANLLANGSFEGEYTGYMPPTPHPDCPYGLCDRAQTAPDWTPWWVSPTESPDQWMQMPEYKPADPQFTDPIRVRTGLAAQQYFTFWGSHEGGFYQQVTAVPGETYCFSIWGHSWSANDNDDAYSGPDYGTINQKIGIDPTGGTDWQSSNVIWTNEHTQYDEYGIFSLTADAAATAMTVFTYSRADWPVQHNNVFWDDAQLVVAEMQAIPNPIQIEQDLYLTGLITSSSQILLYGSEGISWTASVQSGGSLNPVILVNEGVHRDWVTVEVDTSGFGVGSYSATILLTTTESLPNSPLILPIQLDITMPTFSLQPDKGMVIWAVVSEPRQVRQLIVPQLSSAAPLQWTAVLTAPGMSASLTTSSGDMSTPTYLNLDTSGLIAGSYSGGIQFATDQTAVGAPMSFPLTVEVVHSRYTTYLPLLNQP